MTNLNPFKKAIDWKDKTNLDRIVSCLRMLHLNEFLTDREFHKVIKKIKVWKVKNEEKQP